MALSGEMALTAEQTAGLGALSDPPRDAVGMLQVVSHKGLLPRVVATDPSIFGFSASMNAYSISIKDLISRDRSNPVRCAPAQCFG